MYTKSRVKSDQGIIEANFEDAHAYLTIYNIYHMKKIFILFDLFLLLLLNDYNVRLTL